jgi:hypothetical protein
MLHIGPQRSYIFFRCDATRQLRWRICMELLMLQYICLSSESMLIRCGVAISQPLAAQWKHPHNNRSLYGPYDYADAMQL